MSDIQDLGQYVSAIVRGTMSSSQQMNEIAKRLQTSINEAQRLMQGTAQSSFQQLMGQLNMAVRHLVSAASLVEFAAVNGETWVQTHVSGASGGSTSGGGSSNGGSPSDGGTSGGATSSGDASSNGGLGRTHTFHFNPQSERIKSELKKNGVEHRPIQPFGRERTREEIVQRLGGGDKTCGSCSSLAFAYAGNVAGYDVLDFRGGKSRKFFAQYPNVINIARLPGVVSFIESGKNDLDVVNHKLLPNMIEGKEYYLATGRHAAIIRKTTDGYQYLELQDPNSCGWRVFIEGYTLIDRFACPINGYGEEENSVLIDIESLANNQGFLDILGYINTAETKQHKGANGSVK